MSIRITAEELTAIGQVYADALSEPQPRYSRKIAAAIEVEHADDDTVQDYLRHVRLTWFMASMGGESDASPAPKKP